MMMFFLKFKKFAFFDTRISFPKIGLFKLFQNIIHELIGNN